MLYITYGYRMCVLSVCLYFCTFCESLGIWSSGAVPPVVVGGSVAVKLIAQVGH